ncbi:MAG: hypothetical protein LC104_04530 [Bacteroidales bacterium]|nr:hypothetical protein [Bacteroidales bacterium]
MSSEPTLPRTDARQRTTLGNWFRLLLRVLGLTGVLAFLGGAGMLLAERGYPQPERLRTLGSWLQTTMQESLDQDHGRYAYLFALTTLIGLALTVGWLAVELLGGLFLVAGRKTVVGTNAVLQIALAVALLAVVNIYAFNHYTRFDLTRDAVFTLPPEQVEQLRKLRTDSPTTVVVLQLHKTAGTLSERPDAYDYAAERKVVEKVRDLVDQLREFGPQFNVVILDVEEEGYERTLRNLTRTRPGLAEVIRDAPENSIFFYADGKVRPLPTAEAERLGAISVPDPHHAGKSLIYPAAITRMSFTGFYQLDKTASREATSTERENMAVLAGGLAFAPQVRGQGNLVLIPQGRDAFVQKVLALEDRKPKVGLAVIHPYLTSRENYDMYSAAGLRHTLEANGFAVSDVILKRWGGRTGPTPTAYTYEENELDRIEARYNLLNLVIYDRELVVRELKKALDQVVNKGSIADLDRMFRRQFARPIRDEQDRAFIRSIFLENIKVREEELANYTQRLAEVEPRYRELLRDEKAVENRRMTDLQAKFAQYVADCDLLIVPRLTVLDISSGEVIPPGLFALAKEQAAVVKEFVAAGKPVLFAFGPTNVSRPGIPDTPADDDVERLLPRLGIELGRQTIITDREGESLAERSAEALTSTVDVPPLVFDPPAFDPPASATRGQERDVPNPIGGAFRVTSRSVDQALAVKRSGFRPIYLAPGFANVVPFAAEVMFTTPEAWNEPNPLGDADALPKYDPAKPGDPLKGTHDEERKGPFPVGIAVEVPVPAEWVIAQPYPAEQNLAAMLPIFDRGLSALGMTLAAQQHKRPTVRVVAYGHGGLFTGTRLTPGQETLLMHTLNWQLHREDRLPANVADAEKWRFPRVALSNRETAAWRLGTVLGLPLLCVYFGAFVLLMRKVR